MIHLRNKAAKETDGKVRARCGRMMVKAVTRLSVPANAKDPLCAKCKQSLDRAASRAK